MSYQFHYLLSFGSNLGEKHKNINQGLEALKSSFTLLQRSPIVETAPLPHPIFDVSEQGTYANLVCLGKSRLPPNAFYQEIRIIEDKVGHCRSRKWMSRELDIDILFCAVGEEGPFEEMPPFRYSCGDLSVPHPGFFERDFLIKLTQEDLGIEIRSLERHKQTR